jgi:hypothetical protein
MDTVFEKSPAIMLDLATWRSSESVRAFIRTSENVVLLVDDTQEYDWEPGDPDWQAVIRNNGKMDDLTFKTAALCLVQDSGTLVPAIAVDHTAEIRKMYMDASVAVVMDAYLNVSLNRGEFDAA